MNYYNEFDPFAAAWLRELIKAGQIAPGDVDERSIEDVLPSDLRTYTQCHFFAGIGVWSYALRRAGWPDDWPVWTGSCPCQPFSAAGKRTGTADERHLWPAFFHLISQCKPSTVFGEQVASKDGLAWFDTVQADLEGAGYAATAIDLCSAGFGAPHIRQRLYFVGSQRMADPEHTLRRSLSLNREDGRYGQNSGRQEAHGESGTRREICSTVDYAANSRYNSTRERDGGSPLQAARSEQPSAIGGLAISECSTGREERENAGRRGKGSRKEGLEQRPVHGCDGIELANNNNQGLERRELPAERTSERTVGPSRLVNGFWKDAEWIYCRDEKFRPIEPGSSPLATGVANRVGKLRGYGNALTSEVAKGFIEAYLEVMRG